MLRWGPVGRTPIQSEIFARRAGKPAVISPLTIFMTRIAASAAEEDGTRSLPAARLAAAGIFSIDSA